MNFQFPSLPLNSGSGHCSIPPRHRYCRIFAGRICRSQAAPWATEKPSCGSRALQLVADATCSVIRGGVFAPCLVGREWMWGCGRGAGEHRFSLGFVSQDRGALSRRRGCNAPRRCSSQHSCPAWLLSERTQSSAFKRRSVILCTVTKGFPSVLPALRADVTALVSTELHTRISGPQSWLAVSRGQFL